MLWALRAGLCLWHPFANHMHIPAPHVTIPLAPTPLSSSCSHLPLPCPHLHCPGIGTAHNKKAAKHEACRAALQAVQSGQLVIGDSSALILAATAAPLAVRKRIIMLQLRYGHYIQGM